jgi:hypothetical protein
MSQISANLDWAWIEFIGLGLFCPLLIIIGTTALLRYWRGHHR